MSEIDRLSNSGLYPALPIGDKQRDKDGSPPGKPPPDSRPPKTTPPAAQSDPNAPRPPKSIIDEYA